MAEEKTAYELERERRIEANKQKIAVRAGGWHHKPRALGTWRSVPGCDRRYTLGSRGTHSVPVSCIRSRYHLPGPLVTWRLRSQAHHRGSRHPRHHPTQELGIHDSVAAVQQLADARPTRPKRARAAPSEPVDPQDIRRSARPRSEVNYKVDLPIRGEGGAARDPIDYTEKIKQLQLDSNAAEKLRAELEAKRATEGETKARKAAASKATRGPKDSGKGVRVQVGRSRQRSKHAVAIVAASPATLSALHGCTMLNVSCRKFLCRLATTTAAKRTTLRAAQGGRVYDSKFGVTCHWWVALSICACMCGHRLVQRRATKRPASPPGHVPSLPPAATHRLSLGHTIVTGQVPPKNAGGSCDVHAPQVRQGEDAVLLLVRQHTARGNDSQPAAHARACCSPASLPMWAFVIISLVLSVHRRLRSHLSSRQTAAACPQPQVPQEPPRRGRRGGRRERRVGVPRLPRLLRPRLRHMLQLRPLPQEGGRWAAA
jgi:hypothetical protein